METLSDFSSLPFENISSERAVKFPWQGHTTKEKRFQSVREGNIYEGPPLCICPRSSLLIQIHHLKKELSSKEQAGSLAK